jgi:hypothetical protein
MAWLPMQTSQLQAPILLHPGGIAALLAYKGSKGCALGLQHVTGAQSVYFVLLS